uniref:Interferon omega-1-like n=1 Tax=Bos indicus x Bos taurus TaxID=30522 RepID=A0A4W2GUP8_BOBOX
MASENLPQGSTRRRLSQTSSSLIFPMACVLSLLMALVLVSYGPGGSLGCDLSQNHMLVGRKNLRLLGQMRRLSSRFCLQDRKDFTFPQEMVEGSQLQEAQAISVLHEMLQQTFNLFHTERSSAAWDTTLLEQLHTGLHQQLEVPLHSQCGAHPSQGRVFLSHQAGIQGLIQWNAYHFNNFELVIVRKGKEKRKDIPI